MHILTASGPLFGLEAVFLSFFKFNKTGDFISSLLDWLITELVQTKLKTGETTLRQKVMKGTIPSVKIDGAVRFSKTEIDEWFKRHKRKTPENKTTEIETSENKADLSSSDGGEA